MKHWNKFYFGAVVWFSSLALHLCTAKNNELKELASTYPSTSRLHSIGQTAQNDLLTLQINSSPSSNRQCLQPMIKFVANSKGTDLKSKHLLIDFAKHLLSNYDKGDEEIMRLVDNYDIHIMPSMNPDGEPDQNLEREYEAKRVDLNREFQLDGNIKATYDAVLQNRQGEAKALMKWIMDNQFILSVNVGEETDIDQSAMRDFHHYYSNGEEIQLQLQDDELETDRSLIWEKNRNMLMKQFEKLATGIKGYVLDKHADFVRNARIMVEKDDKPVYSTTSCGEYWRSLEPGEYRVSAWGTDKHRSRYTRVKIEEGESLRLDLFLDQFDENATDQWQEHHVEQYPNIQQNSYGRSSEVCGCFRGTTAPGGSLNVLSLRCPAPKRYKVEHKIRLGSNDLPVVLTSPNYPDRYPTGQYKCQYSFKHLKASKKLTLEILQGDLNIESTSTCAQDFLKISKIAGGAGNQFLCQDQTLNSYTFTSSANEIVVTFVVNKRRSSRPSFFKLCITPE